MNMSERVLRWIPAEEVAEGRPPVEIVDEALMLASGGRNIALTLILSPQAFQSGREIDDRFNAALREAGSSVSIPRHYSRNQLLRLPDGTVITNTATEGDIDEKFSFLATGMCDAYQAFAAGIASLCYERDIAPIDLIGMRGEVQTDKGMPPFFSRLALLAAANQLEAGVFIPIIELSRRADVGSSIVHNHMPALLRSGILQPKSDGRHASYPSYVFHDEAAAKPGPTAAQLATTGWNNATQQLAIECYNYAEQHEGAIDIIELRASLAAIDQLAELIRSQQPNKQDESIAKVMHWLAEQGYIAEAAPGKERITHVAITPFGKETVGLYLDLLGQLISGDPGFLAAGQRLAKEFVNDKDKLAWLLSVDFDKGAIKRRMPTSHRAHDLGSIIRRHPKGIITPELVRVTGLGFRALHNTLEKMRDARLARSERVGRVLKWFAETDTEEKTS